MNLLEVIFTYWNRKSEMKLNRVEHYYTNSTYYTSRGENGLLLRLTITIIVPHKGSPPYVWSHSLDIYVVFSFHTDPCRVYAGTYASQLALYNLDIYNFL